LLHTSSFHSALSGKETASQPLVCAAANCRLRGLSRRLQEKMNHSVGCCFVVEARLLRNGSVYWDPRQSFPKDHWEESLQVFGNITVLARTQPSEQSPNGAVLFPAKVSVGEFPYYIGPAAAARKSLSLIRAGRKWARRENAFVLRIPGFVPV